MSADAVSQELPLKIAVDAMGGDHAPAEIVRGAVQFAGTSTDETEVFLVGNPYYIQAEMMAAIAQHPAYAESAAHRIHIHPAATVIEMHEHPMEAFRDKRDASLVVATDLVRQGVVHACFSAGNTGACMVAATQLLGRTTDIKRPAIATLMPTESGRTTLVVDAGANVDCRPSQLVQFAYLGAIYAEKVLGIENPRIGLLSNGEEDEKGNEQVREVNRLLSAERPRLNFTGNVEGNHIFEGSVDVVVCDGFVGNVLLKGAEGIVKLILALLAREVKSAEDDETHRILTKSLSHLRQQVDYAEIGGAPLLGVNGVAFIAHGRSDARAIANGIRQATIAARSGYVEAVKSALQNMRAE